MSVSLLGDSLSPTPPRPRARWPPSRPGTPGRSPTSPLNKLISSSSSSTSSCSSPLLPSSYSSSGISSSFSRLASSSSSSSSFHSSSSLTSSLASSSSSSSSVSSLSYSSSTSFPPSSCPYSSPRPSPTCRPHPRPPSRYHPHLLTFLLLLVLFPLPLPLFVGAWAEGIEDDGHLPLSPSTPTTTLAAPPTVPSAGPGAVAAAATTTTAASLPVHASNDTWVKLSPSVDPVVPLQPGRRGGGQGGGGGGGGRGRTGGRSSCRDVCEWRSSSKVYCSSTPPVVNVREVCLPPDAKQLDLSNNAITRLPARAFQRLHDLEKLDLKDNKIRVIQPGAFANLTSLKKLDLSNNLLTVLNASHFHGLTSLTKLKLGKNRLERIQEGAFDNLPNLRVVDLSNNQLSCGCHLAWLGEAVQQGAFRLSPSSTCRDLNHKNQMIKKLRREDLCNGGIGNMGTSLVELEPHRDQLVFAGDSLQLRCRVSYDKEELPEVVWVWEDLHLKEEQRGAVIRTEPNRNALESKVEIGRLDGSHSGEWSCLVKGRAGNHSRSISVFVISHDTKYCDFNQTINNKGTYLWPKTMAGVTVTLDCTGLSPAPQQARHTCGEDGKWTLLNTTQCPFISKTTRILQQSAFSEVSNVKNLADHARRLRDFTRDGSVFQDPMDVVFLSLTLRKYTSLLPQLVDRKAASLIVDLVDNVLSARKSLLRQAEMEDFACSRIISTMVDLVEWLPAQPAASKPRVEVHQLTLRPDSLSGLTCTWYRRSSHSVERQFRCNAHNYSHPYSSDDEILDAQLHFPESPLYEVRYSTESPSSAIEPAPGSVPEVTTRSVSSVTLGDATSIKLQVWIYTSAHLFPRVGGNSNDGGSHEDSWELTSPVIGVRINGQEISAMHDDLYVTLRSAIYSRDIRAVWWNASANHGHGNWTNRGCKMTDMLSTLIMFRCNRLAHFGLLQDMSSQHHSQAGLRGAEFKLSAPGVYVGSSVCMAFLVASIVTWAAHQHRINTMGKNKHSFVNTWIALLFLVALFTAGVYQTENPHLCQGVGVALHYLTTCVLLWIIVTVSNLYKKVAKALRPPLPPDDPPPDMPLPPKPMLRFYLVGWGIALIVCGISAAVNLQQYGGYSYCFLAWGPSLGAFYAPTAALVFILFVFFLLTHCLLGSRRVSYSEATGATETTELELLEAHSPEDNEEAGGATSGGVGDELSIASSDSTASVADTQHSPLTQLRAHVVTLLLFILTWASAAITTAAPFAIPYHTTIFSIAYAICASSLGCFIFVFFCVSRSDVWEAWRTCSCHCEGTPLHDKDDEGHEVTGSPNNNNNNNSSSATHLMAANNIASPPMATSTQSLESSNTHQTNKSSSLSHSILASNKQDSISKSSNNSHLLSTRLGAMTDNSMHFAPEMFYNPRQLGVAKKFFQKQRLRQMVKQNNLDANKTDSDCNSTVYKPKMPRSIKSDSDQNFESSFLGASSKVNNTNIHVDSMYGYLPPHMSAGKQVTKDTAEVLCVLGPTRDRVYSQGAYPDGGFSPKSYESADRQWSTMPRKPRCPSDNLQSPIRRGGSFPNIMEESQVNSLATSQNSLHDYPEKESSACLPHHLNYLGPQEAQLGQHVGHRHASHFHPETSFLMASMVQGQNLPPIFNANVNPSSFGHHLPPMQGEGGDLLLGQGSDRNSFHSDGTAMSKMTDKSRTPRDRYHHRHRTGGRDRTKSGRPRRKRSGSRGSSGGGSVGIVSNVKENLDWPYHSHSPVMINHMVSNTDALVGALYHSRRSSESEGVDAQRQYMVYPQDPGTIATPKNQVVLETNMDTVDRTGSLKGSGGSSSGGGGGTKLPEGIWPHVLAQSNRTWRLPQNPKELSGESQDPGSGSEGNLDRGSIDLQACEGPDSSCPAWDSEGGEVSWCDGAGEERINVFDAMSGCDGGSMCDGGSACEMGSMCGHSSIDGSASSASMDPAVGTSPRGSVVITDSSYDSPLHRLHQNTPERGLQSSSSLTSSPSHHNTPSHHTTTPSHVTPEHHNTPESFQHHHPYRRDTTSQPFIFQHMQQQQQQQQQQLSSFEDHIPTFLQQHEDFLLDLSESPVNQEETPASGMTRDHGLHAQDMFSDSANIEDHSSTAPSLVHSTPHSPTPTATVSSPPPSRTSPTTATTASQGHSPIHSTIQSPAPSTTKSGPQHFQSSEAQSGNTPFPGSPHITNPDLLNSTVTSQILDESQPSTNVLPQEDKVSLARNDDVHSSDNKSLLEEEEESHAVAERVNEQVEEEKEREKKEEKEEEGDSGNGDDSPKRETRV
ncbi:remoulade isoform X2 [Oratosquilla oratoria]|uniref:remoulade isoform X2 n=1 Tax=Oratosquilla oratoria TaxID=337810 RepID=UPI003F767504